MNNESHLIELEPGHLLVGVDLVSLFTNVPLDEAVENIRQKHRPRENSIELVN